MKKPGKKGSKGLDRRTFIRQAGVAAAGMTIVPSTVVSGLGHVMPSDKLNIAGEEGHSQKYMQNISIY